ncbi:MAG: hypothetical protein JW818_05385 [Pirellulales bacterium]|nr:hypothetical protein [Pirellulales bacterium]
MGKWHGVVIAWCCLVVFGSGVQHAQGAMPDGNRVVRLELEDKQPGGPVQYGLKRLTDALQKRGVRLDDKAATDAREVLVVGTRAKSPRIRRWADQGTIALPAKPESLAVKRQKEANRTLLVVAGHDDTGLMYALLDLADYVEHLPNAAVTGWFNSVAESSESPRNAMRRMRVLLHHEANERAWYHSKEYWDWYIGQLAAQRFNELNLVYSHQTPYMAPMYAWHVKIDEFPDVRPVGVSDEDRQKNLEALRYVAKACHNRGIALTIGVWQHLAWKGSVTQTGAQQESAVKGLNQDNIERYAYLAVKKLLTECPGIARIQLRMNHESGILPSRQTEFFGDCVIRAIRETAPHVKIDLRTLGAKEATLRLAREANLDLRTSFKFYGEFMGQPHPPRLVGARGYSYLSYLHRPFPNPMYNEVWMLGSHRVLLCGSEDYGRRFGRNASFGGTIGFETDGPLAQKGYQQGSTPAWRIFENPKDEYYQYEMERYWAFFRMIGRFTYNPDTSREVWMRPFNKRFGKAAEAMAGAYEAADRVIRLIVASHTENANMYTWPEINMGCIGPAFNDLRGMDRGLFPSIDTQVDDELAGRLTGHLGAIRLAALFDAIADRIDQTLAEADARIGSPDREYRATQNDFHILAGLARYHACRQREGYQMAKFYRTGDGSLLDGAEREAVAALAHWKGLVEVADRQYYDHLVLGPEEQGHWKDKLPAIEGNIQIIREARQVLREHGLFDKGFDFGGPGLDRKYRVFNFYTYGNDHLRQRRFAGVDPGVKYDPRTGFGFTQDRGLKWTSRKQISKTELAGVDNQADPASIPLDMLASDFVHADRDFRFRIDMPGDEYRFTFLFADRSPTPRDHGPFDVRNELRGSIPTRIKNIRVPAGESVVRHFDYNMLKDWYPFVILSLKPSGKNADAMVSALTVHRNAPALAHAPRRQISPEKPCTLSATITMPPRPAGKDGGVSAVLGDRLARATLHFRTGGKGPFQTLPLETVDGLVYRATVGPGRLQGDWLEYYFSAVDRTGRVTRLPEQADHDVFRARLSADTNPPKIIHEPITRWQAGKPMPIEARVRDADGVAVVRVYYRRMDQAKAYDSMIMQRRGDKYVATIPGAAIQPNWDFTYYIEAVDETSTGTSFPDWTKTVPCVFVSTEKTP